MTSELAAAPEVPKNEPKAAAKLVEKPTLVCWAMLMLEQGLSSEQGQFPPLSAVLPVQSTHR
jgi:hypothetical protein